MNDSPLERSWVEEWQKEVAYAKQIGELMRPFVEQWRSQLTFINRELHPGTACALETFIEWNDLLANAPEALQREELKELVDDLIKLGDYLGSITSDASESVRQIEIIRRLEKAGYSAGESVPHLANLRIRNAPHSKSALAALDLWLRGFNDCAIADRICYRTDHMPKEPKTPHRHSKGEKNRCAERYRKEHAALRKLLTDRLPPRGNNVA